MNSTDPVKVDLPLAASVSAKNIVTICSTQSGVIKQCPAYLTTPAVESAVTDMDTAVAALQGTVAKTEQLQAQLATLTATRVTQVATVRLKHDGVETALNVASNNDATAAQAWVGKTKAAPVLTPLGTSTTPPENPALAVIKRSHGSVIASCAREAGAVCYLFQQGGDPAHPEAWPAPSISSGHTFKVHNQPIGQVVYFRMAIVRRGSLQSQWSPVVQIVVR